MRAQEDMVGDERMRAATGRAPAEWLAMLDAAGATEWTHTAIASWLATEHSVPAWWAQAVAVRYEQTRGMRAPGQKADGTFTSTATRVIANDPDWLLDHGIEILSAKFGGEPTSVNPAAKAPNARWTLAGRERLLLTVTVSKPDRCTVGLTHSGIAQAEDLAAAKTVLVAALREIEQA